MRRRKKPVTRYGRTPQGSKTIIRCKVCKTVKVDNLCPRCEHIRRLLSDQEEFEREVFGWMPL